MERRRSVQSVDRRRPSNPSSAVTQRVSTCSRGTSGASTALRAAYSTNASQAPSAKRDSVFAGVPVAASKRSIWMARFADARCATADAGAALGAYSSLTPPQAAAKSSKKADSARSRFARCGRSGSGSVANSTSPASRSRTAVAWSSASPVPVMAAPSTHISPARACASARSQPGHTSPLPAIRSSPA